MSTGAVAGVAGTAVGATAVASGLARGAYIWGDAAVSFSG